MLMMVLVSVSFFYGWYVDDSKPRSGAGWADQSLYTATTHRLAGGDLPTKHQLHFPIGYPLLGVFGKVIDRNDPFMAVSFGLLIASMVLGFLAVRHLFGDAWAVIFSLLLFLWDGIARTFHFSSELFAIPWSNQVLFFLFAFYLWLFTVKFKKPPSLKLAAAVGLISGLAFVTREESILFIVPALVSYLFFTKAAWQKWLVCFGLVGLCFVPQLAIKYRVAGSATVSTHDDGYAATLTDKYFQPSLLYRNVKEVIVNSGFRTEADYSSVQNGCQGVPSGSCTVPRNPRPALLQAAPWLWLAPVGFVLVFVRKRYPKGLKIFFALSAFLMLFYLSGSNMSWQKLQFHCLRYMSPGFIALVLAVVVVIRELYGKFSDIKRNHAAKPKFATKKGKK